MDPLRILVIDEHAEMALPVIDALAQRGHRCELQAGGRGALAALSAKRDAGRPYQVVVANAALPDIEPIEFLRELRARNDASGVVLYAVMAQLDRALFEAAAALDARFLDLPVDRGRLVLLVESLGIGSKSGAQRASDQPFFGTGRITRATPPSSRYDQGPTTSVEAARPATPATPAASEPKAPAAPRTFRTPLPATGNVVRQGTDRYVANAGTVPTTSRVRRGVTGRIHNPATSPLGHAPSWRVACASCHREFMVEARAQAYNVVCVHCGQLNRIEPRAT